jgi:Ni,Fe-hydrogenase III large subunit
MASLGGVHYKLDIEGKHVAIKNMKTLLSKLEEEYDKMNDLLLYRELIVQRTKDEITKKHKQINDLRENLRHAKITESSKIFDILDKIKENA